MFSLPLLLLVGDDVFQLGSGLSGAQGGTVFADPILSKQMAQGKLTKSSIDRFTIVLMGGIAAEAINYGSSEVCT